jgi:hypothetical protein
MLLLYCANGVVIATHDSIQNIQAATYGANVSIIPWDMTAPLARIGTPPRPGQIDGRPYAAPTLSGAAQLSAYANTKQGLIMNGGISVNVGTNAAPQNIEASTDAASLILLQGAYTIAASNAAATFQWVSNGVAVTLTAAQMIAILNAVTTFLQQTFSTLAGVLFAINAGTITTQAQVNTPPSPIPAWPVNS